MKVGDRVIQFGEGLSTGESPEVTITKIEEDNIYKKLITIILSLSKFGAIFMA